MDVEVLPGPSLAERARTATAQARLATISWGAPAASGATEPVRATAAIRVDRLGQPVLLLPPRVAVTRALVTAAPVTATVPAPAPLRSLALTGVVQPRSEADGRIGYRLDLRS